MHHGIVAVQLGQLWIIADIQGNEAIILTIQEPKIRIIADVKVAELVLKTNQSRK